MGLNAFTIDGKSSADFGVFVSGTATYNAPQRDIEVLEIPGRNGSLTIDHGRFFNIQIRYDCYITSDFVNKFMAFKAFMLSEPGYRTLEDTYNTDHYRRARFVGGIEAEPQILASVGRFSVTFDCDPRLFRKDGKTALRIDSDATVYNPTLYDSKPLIRAYGVGKIAIGNAEFEVLQSAGAVDIDCEMMEAYYGSVNCNGNVKGTFPTLKPGNNAIELDGIERIELTPRWWTV